MIRQVKALAVLACGAFAPAVWAADALTGEVQKQPLNVSAIAMFVAFVAFTLGITYWASKRNKSASDYYAAGGKITGFQNGLAIAGDYMSAASFLGISALVFTSGYDGLIYSIGFLVGWPIILFLIAERLRNLGKYTFADVASYRLGQKEIRTLSASGSLVVVAFYLIAQMVGAGKLIELLFGLDYHVAVILVGILMCLYVLFGGMLATTWVQIIKAVLLLSGASFMALMVMKHVGFDFNTLFSEAIKVHAKGEAIMSPGGLVKDPISAFSLGLALMFGTAGLPHILIRFYTVPNAKAARKSVNWAIGIIGAFYLMTIALGFGAAALVGKDEIIASNPSGNTAAPLLALHVGGVDSTWGAILLATISAVAFATIRAVVAGLTLASSSSFAHDIYANVIRKGQATEKEEMRAARWATVFIGIVSIALCALARDLTVAGLVALAFAVAASANLPTILYSLFWKRFTTQGALWSIYGGLIVAVGLVLFSPVVSGDPKAMFPDVDFAWFPLKNPGIISIPFGFLMGWLGTVLSKEEPDKAKYAELEVRSLTGTGAH